MTNSADPKRSTARSPRTLRTASVAFTLGAVALAACGSGDEQALSAGGDAGRGASLYASACASCHGSDLRGTERGPSQLSIVYEPDHHDDASYRSAIVQGAPAHHWDFGDMPAVGGLDDDEVDAIIDFIRSEQQIQGFEPYERP